MRVCVYVREGSHHQKKKKNKKKGSELTDPLVIKNSYPFVVRTAEFVSCPGSRS